MKHLKYRLLFLLLISGCLMLLTGCGEEDAPPKQDYTPLIIVSGSENKGIEPLIRSFAAKERMQIRIEYKGSVDITLMLSDQGSRIPYDAVWPANSLWITLGDRQKVVKHAESIMRSPVALGLRKSLAQRLGWVDRPIAVKDILEAADLGRLRFAMTSATQSNSGASAYLGFLYALSGSPGVLQLEHLEKKEVQDNVRRLLSRINRSSGSSGWLKDMVVNHYDRYQAMFNYEAMIIEANQELVSRGQEPLFAVYPTDGMMIADSPFGYVDKGNPKKEAMFKKLQAYLLSDEVQDEILKQGRRTGLIGLNPEKADKTVFNPDWGIDVTRIISSVPTPAEPVIRKALSLYQTLLRKPSCTAYVLDVSGSMGGKGIEDLKAAMSTLLDPFQAERYMLQASSRDIHMIVPFNGTPLKGIQGQGNSEKTMLDLLKFVQNLQAGGGTNIYSAAAAALGAISKVTPLEDYFPAIILMTDGKSGGDIRDLQNALKQFPIGADIPIHSITFGDADESQLREVSNMTIGRVFPGHDLVKAFRQAKGYN